ncbi:MAG: hypothetical protein SNJ82_00960 [Gemmataceae bacterium]
MQPFVGAAYLGPDHLPTLLIGESNYMPPASTVHLNAEQWYAGTQSTLTAEEVMWLDCRGLLSCKWDSPGHNIYREINRCVGETGVVVPDRGVSAIAFMNAFQRPAAATGRSMKECITALDRSKSLEVLVDTVRAIAPELVVFMSRFAGAVFGHALHTTFPALRVECVSHPADPFHWRRNNYNYGRSKFMQILRTHFLKPPTAVPSQPNSRVADVEGLPITE